MGRHREAGAFEPRTAAQKRAVTRASAQSKVTVLMKLDTT
jgi:hypothetical protein